MKMVSMSVGVPSISKCFLFNTGLRTPTTRYSVNCTLKPSLSASVTNMALPNTTNRKLPILLFDIMDTLVRDPFYEDVPAFFGMSFKELIDCKHPTAWLEFEKGSIDEVKPTVIDTIQFTANSAPLLHVMYKDQSFLNFELNCKLGI